MTGDEADPDTVDSIVDAAVERADATPDTFRPVSVDDSFDKRVRDDHAPNQALHDALRAAAEDDDRIHSVNLIGSHAPGNTHKGEPRYHVRVDVRNDGMGHPVLGATVAGRMVDRGDVRIEDVVECSDDHLVVSLRPRETRVEPIDVPVSDIPDRVLEREVEVDLTDLKTLSQGRPVDKGSVTVTPSEGTVERLQDAARCFEHSDDFPVDLMPNVAAWSLRRHPVEPIAEWVEDNRDVFDTPGTLTPEGVDSVAGMIADAIAAYGEDEVLYGDDPETVFVPCGCGDYRVGFPSGEVPDSFDVVCPECGNHFGYDEPDPDEPDFDADEAVRRMNEDTDERNAADYQDEAGAGE